MTSISAWIIIVLQLKLILVLYFSLQEESVKHEKFFSFLKIFLYLQKKEEKAIDKTLDIHGQKLHGEHVPSIKNK